MTISDQHKNSFEMSQSGISLRVKNKNKLTLDSSGITPGSSKDINFNAKGKVVKITEE